MWSEVEWPYKGGHWWEWLYKKCDQRWEWPYEGGHWWEWPYKSGTLYITSHQVILDVILKLQLYKINIKHKYLEFIFFTLNSCFKVYNVGVHIDRNNCKSSIQYTSLYNIHLLLSKYCMVNIREYYTAELKKLLYVYKTQLLTSK